MSNAEKSQVTQSPAAEIPTIRWQSVGHLVRQQAAHFGDRTLLRFESSECSFAQFEELTNRLGNVLKSHGVGKDDRVAVIMPNCIEFPVSWVAIAKIGAVMVPVNIQYRESDMEYTLNDSGAIFAIAGPDQLELLQQVRSRTPALREIGVLGPEDAAPGNVVNLRAEMASASAELDIDEINYDALLNLQYTSGTTGFPKGCMLTHEYWMLIAQEALRSIQLTDEDVVLTAQPFYYMDPQWNTILCLMAGAPLVILPRFSASTFWKSVKENGVTFFYLLGTMPVYLLKQPEDPENEKGHKVRLILCSGIVPQLHSTFESRWNVPWREAYGTTETGCDLFVPADDAESVGTGAMGKPVPGKEAKCVDDAGNEVSIGEVGELILRGKPMMLGYWNKPEATAEKIRDGWLYTGDLVFRDSRGYYHMVGRTKEMIRRTGENIAAVEVESILAEHPAVRAAAVVPVPDELRGEEVKAFIQLQPGYRPDRVNPQDLIDFSRQRLAAFKTPRYIEFVDDFPRTPSERIAKHKLLDMKPDQRAGTYDATTGVWG